VISFLKSLITRLRGNEFVRNTAILSLGTAFAQGLNILAMPILSRLYTPADFGLLAIFVAVSSIVATSITLRYETAILLPKRDQEAKSLMGLSALLVFFGSIFFTVTAYLLPLSLKKSFGIEILENWLMSAIFCGIATSLVAIGTGWYNRNKSYKNIATLRIVQSSVSISVSLLLGIWGVATGMMMAQLVAFSFVAFYVIWSLKSIYSRGNNFDFMEVAKKHSAAPKYLLPTSLLDVVTLHLPIFLITAWFSTETAGQFSMAWKILGLPSGLIGGAIGQVFYQKFSVLWPDSLACKKLLTNTWTTLALIGFIPMLVIIFFGVEIFSFFLGSAWEEAGSIASIIAPMLFLMLISSPTSGTYLVLGMQKRSLLFGISVLIYRPVCIYMGFFYQNLTYGLIALVFAEIVQISLYQILAFKKIEGVL
jgi:O-antigen/teichoic acid export membrane protein